MRKREKGKLIDKKGFVWCTERLQATFKSLIDSQEVENLSLRCVMWRRESKFGLQKRELTF